MKRLARVGFFLVLSIAAAACSASYLLRAAYEEARILWHREPIADVLARGEIDAATREKLSLVLAARTFAASELGFEVGNSYATLSRVDGDAVVHVVTAAYRDRLEPYTWRYPIVGRVPYRGFFDLGSAETYAEELEATGLDTAVWQSIAFSTLGWFADPLFSSVLERDPLELVTVVFHELTHAQVYVPSAAEFNESLANFTGHRAAIEFFCDDTTGNHADRPLGIGSEVAERCERARTRWRDECAYGAALASAARALRELYAAKITGNERSRRRSEILSGATRSWAREASTTTPYRETDFAGFNNAVLLQQVLYRSELDLFEDAWRSQGEDLGRTLRRIARAVRVGGNPFAAVSEGMSGGPRGWNYDGPHLAEASRLPPMGPRAATFGWPGAGGAACGCHLVFEAPEEVIRTGDRCVNGEGPPVLADDAGEPIGGAELVTLCGDDRNRARQPTEEIPLEEAERRGDHHDAPDPGVPSAGLKRDPGAVRVAHEVDGYSRRQAACQGIGGCQGVLDFLWPAAVHTQASPDAPEIEPQDDESAGDESVGDGGDYGVVHAAPELGVGVAEHCSTPRVCSRPREDGFQRPSRPLHGESGFLV